MKFYGKTIMVTLLKNWSTLLSFEIIYRVFGFSVLLPLVQYLLSLLPAAIGKNYLSQENILLVFQNPFSTFLIFCALILICIYIYFEIAALIIYSEESWQQKRLTVLKLWKTATLKAIGLLRPGNIAVFLLLPAIMLSFFSITSIYLQMARIPEFILDFLKSSALYYSIYITCIIFFHILLFFYIFGFPFLLIHNDSFFTSFRKSVCLLKKRKIRTALALLLYGSLFYIFLLAVFLVSVCLLAAESRFFYGIEAGRNLFQLFFISFLKIFRIIFNVLLSVFICTFSVSLYHQYQGDIRPKPVKVKYTLKHILTRISVVLFTVCLLILFSESEIAGDTISPSSKIFTPKIVAHRAGAFFAPENTISALNQAVKDGATIAEIDVQQLKDGTLIVMHDKNFKRTAGINLNVWDADYSLVKKLDAGSRFSRNFTGEPIPTLDEMILAAQNRIDLMIELKATGYEKNLEKEVLSLIEKYDMQEHCIIASMNINILKQIKKLNPKMQTAYISVLLITEQYDLKYLDIYSLETASLSAGLVSQAHFQGKEVYAWTANLERNINKILLLEADGLVTDNPALVKSHLKNITQNSFLTAITEFFFPSAFIENQQ